MELHKFKQLCSLVHLKKHGHRNRSNYRHVLKLPLVPLDIPVWKGDTVSWFLDMMSSCALTAVVNQREKLG